MPGMNRWALPLFGAGAGVAGGALAGEVAIVPGLAVAAVGLVLLAFPSRSGGRDLVAPAPPPLSSAPGKPSVAGLGSQVERILGLAQEQADAIVAEARAEAERLGKL